MMKKTAHTINLAFAFLLCLIILSCKDDKENRHVSNTEEKSSLQPVFIKPSSNYTDSLFITIPAAVFYHPDSMQLIQIKAMTDPMVFDGTMHEFFYQMRNARTVLKKNWPRLKIIEAKNYRYLVFVKNERLREYVDLNTKNDAYGLFVFDGKKLPRLIDMTNIETEVSFYLKEQ